jgi:hypothetical protein
MQYDWIPVIFMKLQREAAVPVGSIAIKRTPPLCCDMFQLELLCGLSQSGVKQPIRLRHAPFSLRGFRWQQTNDHEENGIVTGGNRWAILTVQRRFALSRNRTAW